MDAAHSISAQFNFALSRINHIIFMLQENRSFDHYLGHLPQYLSANNYPQTLDGEPDDASNPSDNGSSVSAFHFETQCVQNQSPSWNESHKDYNLQNPLSGTATLDGFVHISGKDAQDNGYSDTKGMRAMGYYDSDDLPFYYFLAANFATSDR